MFKNKLKYIFIFFITLCFFKTSFSQNEEEIRAMWIFNIANNVTWQNEDTISVYTIGVYTRDKNVFEILSNQAIASDTIKGKPCKVFLFKRFSQLKYTNILYVAKENNTDIPRINSYIENKNTLLITDRLEDNDNFMVNFRPLDEGTKKIEVDKKNILAHNLNVNKQLLIHGGNAEELKDIYAKTAKELDQQKEELDKQKKELAQQKKELQQKIKETKKQKEKIQTQNTEITEQEIELTKLIENFEEQEKKLTENMEVLEKQESLISNKQSELTKKESELESKSKEILKIEEEIQEKQEKLTLVEKKFNETKSTLSTAKEKIQTQKGIIIIVAIFLIFVIIAVVFIWRALAMNRKINKELKHKNAEINRQKNEIQNQSTQLEINNKELEKLSIVADKAQNGVMIMDSIGNFKWVNAGFTKMYGYTLQLLINELDENIVKASSDPEIKIYIKNCIKNKTHVTYEAENRKRTGEKIWVKTTLTPILNDKNEITRLVAIDTDITETKIAEQKIRKQHAKITQQANLLESSNKELEKLSIVATKTDNAVLIMDKKGDFEWVNPAFTRLFGSTLEEFKENVSNNIISSRSNTQISGTIKKAIEEKKPLTYQFKTKNKKGENIWIQASLTPVFKEDGEIDKFIAVDSDITKIKKAEKAIMEKNEELEIQKEKIQFQNQQIHSSINYAQTIQSAILPRKQEMNKFFSSFIIFLPKDIVSGDFYWFAHIKSKNITFVAAVDCTGHGVPGAFMSMITSRMLNEITIEKKVHSPKEILEQMDIAVKKALRQDKTSNNDGLDISLCSIENKSDKNKIIYCGAKRPLFYYQKSKKNNKIITVKGTRRSIGGIKRILNKAKFENNELILTKDAVIYLTTDGYIDQNDSNRKRIGTETFIDILNKIKEEPLKKQKEILEQKLFSHMKDTEQRDDITMLGIKLK